MRLFAVALMSLTAVCAHADTILTAATASVVLTENGTTNTYNGFSSNPGLQSDFLGNPGAEVSGGNESGPSPQVSTLVSLYPVPPSTGTYQAISTASYEFAVNGPANQFVSVNFFSSSNSSVSESASGSYASGSLTVQEADSNADIFSDSMCAGACIPNNLPSHFLINQAIAVQTDTPYLITMSVDSLYSGEGAYLPGSYVASSAIDPTITLDTSDPAYSLEFSPGLIPASTPEPATETLCATGFFAVLGMTLRKQRSSVRSAGPA